MFGLFDMNRITEFIAFTQENTQLQLDIRATRGAQPQALWLRAWSGHWDGQTADRTPPMLDARPGNQSAPIYVGISGLSGRNNRPMLARGTSIKISVVAYFGGHIELYVRLSQGTRKAACCTPPQSASARQLMPYIGSQRSRIQSLLQPDLSGNPLNHFWINSRQIRTRLMAHLRHACVEPRVKNSKGNSNRETVVCSFADTTQLRNAGRVYSKALSKSSLYRYVRSHPFRG